MLSACESMAPQPIVDKLISLTHKLQNALYGNFDFSKQSL